MLPMTDTAITTNGNGYSTLPQPVDPKREYAAGGRQTWADYYARSLPQYVDDVAGALGADIYDRMQRDPQVAACLRTIKVSILAHGWQLPAAMLPEDATDADRVLAAEVAAFCQHVLHNLDIPFADVLGNLLDALAEGNKVAEKVWQNERWEGTARLGLRAVKVKPRQSVAFAVDPYMNLIGILARIPGQPFPVRSGEMIGLDPANPPANLLPRDKFVVFSHEPRDADPRGTSLLRPAYDWWWTKVQAVPEFMKYLSQFATPSLVGYTPELPAGTSYVPVATSDSTPEEALLTMLLDFQNGSALSLPGGSKVDPIWTQGGEEAFKTIFALCDAQITIAILLQLLATGTAAHQTNASTAEHGNILDDVISRVKGSLEAVVIRDIIRPLVALNWGDQAMHCCPGFSLGAVEQQDLTPLMTAISNLKRSGYLSDDQLVACDVLLGLPVRQAAPAEGPADLPPEPVPPMDEEDEDEDEGDEPAEDDRDDPEGADDGPGA
jgi:phage gp29-like protein